jgi:hypothetical protein
LAFVWEVDSDDVDVGIGPTWEVRVHRFAGGGDRRLGEGFISGACGSIIPEDPNVAGTGVVYLQELNNCDASDGGTHSFFVRAVDGRRANLRVERFPVRFPVGEAYALAYDAGTAYWLYGPNADDLRGGNPCARTGCPLVLSTALPFARVPDPDPLLAGEG